MAAQKLKELIERGTALVSRHTVPQSERSAFRIAVEETLSAAFGENHRAVSKALSAGDPILLGFVSDFEEASDDYPDRLNNMLAVIKEYANQIDQRVVEQPAHQQEAHAMTPTQKDARNIFVVHGRHGAARDAIFDFLRSVGLNPLEWEEARRLTGKVSPYIGEVLDSAFTHAQAIVVLLTGDDEARLREHFRGTNEPEHEVRLTPQARPNVLFEAGMALGRHPDRTLLIEIGDLRPFSDIAGRHVIRLRTGSPSERTSIIERLKTAECVVNTDGRTDWLERDFFSKALDANPK